MSQAPEPKTDRQLLETILTALVELTEQVEELKVQQEEIVEKIDNISTPGTDYGYDE